MSRFIQSTNAQTAQINKLEAENEKIEKLEAENEKLRIIVNSAREDGPAPLQCGVCSNVANASSFTVCSPCGHCFCAMVNY